MKQYLSFILALLALVSAGASHTAPMSCYGGELAALRPPITDTILTLVDTSSDVSAVKQGVLDSTKAVTEKLGRQIVVLSYAGHAPGESLKVEFESLLEAPITDPQVIDNTVIKVFKAHTKCIREQHQQARDGLQATMQQLFSAMPVTTARSEIAYAVSSALNSYVQSGQNVLVLHISDGLQHAQRGRSFYGADKQPRRIDPAVELKAFRKDAATAPRAKPNGAYVTMLWWGMLSMSKPRKSGEKPVYLDTNTISSFKHFWEQYASSLGVDRIQVGSPNLLNPDLNFLAKQPL